MQLQKRLNAGEFAVLAEMEPPKGADGSLMAAHAAGVKRKVDAFVVPEMSNAVMRMSSLGGSVLLQSRGFETVMQVCCRDRNRLALQADLLAGAALGVTNIMAVTGEDPSFGDHPKARPVNDLDLFELLSSIGTLASGRDLGGVDLQGTPRFLVGSTVNAGLSGGALDLELENLDKKAELGAEFFVTPPVFDPSVLSGLMKKMEGRKGKIFPTVLLLKSVGMARYIDRNLPHVSVPEEIIGRIQKSPERTRECIHISGELIRAFKEEGAAGVLISTIGWEEKLPSVLAAAGI